MNLAIIGSGGIAQTHANAIALLPDVRLAAIQSRNLEKARELAAPSGAEVVESLETLLADEAIDAVLIATPSGAHAASALPALRAGKHVLCEKPLEISTERVHAMIAEAKTAGRILAGFFPLRCGFGARVIHAALQAGRFGKLTFLSARVKWWRGQAYYGDSTWRGTRALDGGGALINQGIHAVDLIQWLGGPVAEAAAFAGTLAHSGLEVEDTLAACLKFQNGALGTIEASTSCYPGLDLSIEISGEAGSAILVNDRIDFWKFADEAPDDEAIRSGTAGGEVGGGSSDPLAISCEGHRRQIEGFCQAISGTSSTGIIDGYEAGRAVAIVEAIYESSRTGKSQPIPN